MKPLLGVLNTESLTISAWLYAVATVVIVISIYLLKIHFQSATSRNHILCIAFSFFPLILMLIYCSLLAVIFNQSLFTWINHQSAFIHDDYCTIYGYIAYINYFCISYSLWIFYVCRLRYYFKSTPFQLSIIAFILYIILFTIVTLYSIFIPPIVFENGHEIFVGFDSDKYSLCTPSPRIIQFIQNLNIYQTLFIIFTFMNHVMISMVLLYLLYRKINKLQILQSSIHFDQTIQANNVNPKTLRRCLFFGFTSVILRCISMACFFAFNIVFIDPISMIFNVISVMISFPDCMNNDHSPDIGIDNDDVLSVSELAERDEYLNKIMSRYYSITPIAEQHQTLNNGQILIVET